MTIELTPTGLNVKRLRAEAKKLSKSLDIPLSEAQNRIALEHTGSHWAGMIEQCWKLIDNKPFFFGLARKSPNKDEYDLIDCEALWDQIHGMEADGLDQQHTIDVRRERRDGIVDDDTATIVNVTEVFLGEGEGTWAGMGNESYQVARSLIEQPSLVKCLQLALELRNEALRSSGVYLFR